MKTAELPARCLENEGAQFFFGLPDEETLERRDALRGLSHPFHRDTA